MNKWLKLDVGCGANPRGDVNCDLFIGETPHTQKTWIINPRKIKNFVKCDGQHLPFKTSSFELVTSYEVIEHVDNPFQFLKELIRVSYDKIILTTPHRFKKPSSPSHKQHFTITWFKNACQKLQCAYLEAEYIKYSCYPHHFVPLIRLPRQIRVLIRK